MDKRLHELDDELPEESGALIREQTMTGVMRAKRRHRHAERLSDMVTLDLDDPEVMAGAWRQRRAP